MITKEQILNTKHDIIYLLGYFNSDGTAQRWRINGNVKTWKRSPERFQVPLKHGLRDYAYLTEDNNHLFTLEEPKPINKNMVREMNSKFRY